MSGAEVSAAPVWIFDVDGTLIGSIRADVLRPGAVELLDALADRGATCVLWSAGGREYADRMAKRHGIDRYFAGTAAKQARDDTGRYVSPELSPELDAAPRFYVDDAPADAPADGRLVPVRQFLGGNLADKELVALTRRLEDVSGTTS